MFAFEALKNFFSFSDSDAIVLLSFFVVLLVHTPQLGLQWESAA